MHNLIAFKYNTLFNSVSKITNFLHFVYIYINNLTILHDSCSISNRYLSPAHLKGGVLF